MYTEDDDSEHKIALTLVLGIAILVVTGVLGFLGLSGYLTGKPATASAPAASAKVEAHDAAADAKAAKGAEAATSIANLKDDQSAVIVENGVVKFYFASGKADVAQGSNEALAGVVKAIAAGQKAVISGYHDTTGDPAKNAELSKKRAMSVRDTLLALGVAADKLELKKPEQAQGTGNNNEARRVEVVLVK